MNSLRYLNKYFIKYKWPLFWGILTVILSNYFYIKMPVFLKDLTDTLTNDGNGIVNVIGLNIHLDKNNPYSIALKILLIYMGLVLLKGIFLFFTRQLIIKMSRHIEYDLKNEIYQQYQRLDYNFYKKNATGDLMNRISEDVSQVRMYLGPGVMYNVNLVVVTALSLYQMIQINAWLTLIVLIPLPIMSFLIYNVSKKVNKASKEVQHQQSTLSTLVQESFSGIRILKAFQREDHQIDKFTQASKDYRKKNIRLIVINALFQPTIAFLIGLSTVLAIYVGGLFSFAGTITFGGVTAFIFFLNSLTWPFASLGWLTAIIQRAEASQGRINEFLKLEPEITNPTNTPFNYKGTIEFKNVSYTYPGDLRPTINNISFKINPEETLAILGRTASGKSTLLKLILRQIDPQEGEILIDSQPLKTINLDDYRNEIGVVPQEVFLFSDTIKENILFGHYNPIEVTQEEVEEICKYCHVHHNIMSFPEQYETQLGERGVNLSGGQKQRVSIARALIRKPALLLLDDCLSAVDTQTEEIILNHLKNDIHPLNTIIVSHRISSIRNANHIIVIEKGEILEEGSHEKLLNDGNFYAELYFNQLTEEK